MKINLKYIYVYLKKCDNRRIRFCGHKNNKYIKLHLKIEYKYSSKQFIQTIHHMKVVYWF